jgi:hypothetical protein
MPGVADAFERERFAIFFDVANDKDLGQRWKSIKVTVEIDLQFAKATRKRDLVFGFEMLPANKHDSVPVKGILQQPKCLVIQWLAQVYATYLDTDTVGGWHERHVSCVVVGHGSFLIAVIFFNSRIANFRRGCRDASAACSGVFEQCHAQHPAENLTQPCQLARKSADYTALWSGKVRLTPRFSLRRQEGLLF